MSFRKGFLKNFLTVGGYDYAAQVVRVIGSIILARLLMPSEFGTMAIISIFTGLIMIFRYSGLNYAVIKNDDIDVEGVQFISIIFGFLQAIVLILISYPIAWFYNDAELVFPIIAVSVIFLASGFSIVPMALLSKKLKFAHIGRINFLSTIIALTTCSGLAYFGFSYWALIIQEIIFYSVLAIAALIASPISLVVPSRQMLVCNLKQLKSIISNIVGFNIVNYFSRNTDNLLVGKIYGTSDLGIYNRAYTFIYLIIGLISGVSKQVAYPSLIALQKKGSETINGEIVFIMQTVGLLVFPLSFVCIVFSTELVILLWGENWIEVANILPYFGVVLLAQVQTNIVGELFILKNMERRYFKLGILTSGLFVFGILVGASISFYAIPIIYSIMNLVTFLVILYWAFYKSFNFTLKIILINWSPIVISSIILIYGLTFNEYYLCILTLIIYLIWTVTLFLSQNYLTIVKYLKRFNLN